MVKKKTTSDFYQIAGTRFKTPFFLWPVYSNYEILTIEDFLLRYKIDKARLYNDDTFVECLDNLGSQTVILPNYSNLSQEYSPLQEKTNLFASFAQLTALANDESGLQSKFLSDDEILRWVGLNGLPTYRPLYIYENYLQRGDLNTWLEPDNLSSFQHWSYCEQVLRVHSQHYAMLKDTFLGLNEFFRQLFLAVVAITQNDAERTSTALTLFAPHHLCDRLDDEGFFMYKNPNIDTKSELINIVSGVMTLLLSGVKLKLTFEKNETTNTHVAVQSWAVPDLWSAMMLQLYHHLAVNQEFRKCPSCGNYFSMMGQRKDRIYCPEDQGQYLQCKQHAKDLKRRKL